MEIIFKPVNLFLAQNDLNIKEKRPVGFYEDLYYTEKYPSLEAAMEKKDYITVSTGHNEGNLLGYHLLYHLNGEQQFVVCEKQDPRFGEDAVDNYRMLEAVIKTLEGKIPETEINGERSYNDGDDLTFWEKDYLVKTKCCPDCKTGTLIEGPHGGCSINWKCGQCGSRFNLTVWQQSLTFAQRISDSSIKRLN